MRLNSVSISSSVRGVAAVNVKSAAPHAACLLAGPVDNAVCVLLRMPWSMAHACAVLKVYSITALPRMMKITVLTSHVPVLQPMPVPAGAQWDCWRYVCPAFAATPLPGCALLCAGVPTTGLRGPAAGAATPTLCAARFPIPTLILAIPRSAAKLWRNRYDRLE